MNLFPDLAATPMNNLYNTIWLKYFKREMANKIDPSMQNLYSMLWL